MCHCNHSPTPETGAAELPHVYSPITCMPRPRKCCTSAAVALGFCAVPPARRASCSCRSSLKLCPQDTHWMGLEGPLKWLNTQDMHRHSRWSQRLAEAAQHAGLTIMHVTSCLQKSGAAVCQQRAVRHGRSFCVQGSARSAHMRTTAARRWFTAKCLPGCAPPPPPPHPLLLSSLTSMDTMQVLHRTVCM